MSIRPIEFDPITGQEIFNVTRHYDNGLGNQEGTLSWAIGQANHWSDKNTIKFHTNVNMEDVMRPVGFINSNITIDGNGFTLDGDTLADSNTNGDFRPLFVRSGEVEIKDLSIVNGLSQGTGGGAGMGGGLFIHDGNVKVSNVTFDGNKAQGGSGGGGGGMMGSSPDFVSDLASYGYNALDAWSGYYDERTFDPVYNPITDWFYNGSDGRNGGGSQNGGRKKADGYNGSGALPGNFGGGGADGGDGTNGKVAGFAHGRGGHGANGSNGGFGGGGGNGGNGGDGARKRNGKFVGDGGHGGRGGHGGLGAGGGAGGEGSSGDPGGDSGSGGLPGFGGAYSKAGGAGAGMGGAIFIRTGSLELEDVTFSNNSAVRGGDGADGYGGAVFAMHMTENNPNEYTASVNNQGMPDTLPTVTLNSSTSFSGNTASNWSGAPNTNLILEGKGSGWQDNFVLSPVMSSDITAYGDDLYGRSGNRYIGRVDSYTVKDSFATIKRYDNAPWYPDDNIQVKIGEFYDTYGKVSFDYDYSGTDLTLYFSGHKTATAKDISSSKVDDFLRDIEFIGEVDTTGTENATDILIGDSNNNHIFAIGGDDYVYGGDGNDTILGGRGNDVLLGGDGNDYIRGYEDSDVMIGGEGADTFAFLNYESWSGVGRILDYEAIDTVQVSQSAYGISDSSQLNYNNNTGVLSANGKTIAEFADPLAFSETDVTLVS